MLVLHELQSGLPQLARLDAYPRRMVIVKVGNERDLLFLFRELAPLVESCRRGVTEFSDLPSFSSSEVNFLGKEM